MDNSQIGDILLKLRIEARLSVGKVSEILRTQYSILLNPDTLCNYEKGRTLPNIRCFLALCAIYNCNDILAAFGYSKYTDKYSSYAAEIKQIIQRYILLNPAEKGIILGALGIDAKSSNPKAA